MKITVLGGTGYGGAAVAAEAAKRGHQVTAVSRRAPKEAIDGVTYLTGDLLDVDFLTQAVDGADVVFEALSPRGDMADKAEIVFSQAGRLAADKGFRYGVLGGVSSVLVAPDGPRLFDVMNPPADVLPEILVGIRKLDALKQAPAELDWFYVSPAAEFGSWLSSPITGSYRISDDVLLSDENGKSEISAADLALAVLDEIEHPTHTRRRFHVAH